MASGEGLGYLLNRHRMVLHRRGGARSRSGNAAHIKNPVEITSLDDARQLHLAGAKLCAYCFPDGRLP